MQDEVNEKTVALSIKAAKLTAAMLQAAIKKLLAEGKKQLDKQALPKKGKQSLKQLMKHSTAQAFPISKSPTRILKPLQPQRKNTVSTLR